MTNGQIALAIKRGFILLNACQNLDTKLAFLKGMRIMIEMSPGVPHDGYEDAWIKIYKHEKELRSPSNLEQVENQLHQFGRSGELDG